MLIDIGADSYEDAIEIGVKPGQQIVPICPFTPMANEKKIMAKAWDNRYGCGLAIELLKELKDETLPNTLYSGATVQEEVGSRAQTAANMIQPDIFYALDASPANDASGDKTQFGQLGKGALLRIYDRTMVNNIEEYANSFQIQQKQNNIPYQYFISQGGTDAGRVHTSNSGIPSAVIGVCARYVHTHASILHVDDYAAAKELITKLVRTTDKTTLETIKNNAQRGRRAEEPFFLA